MVEKVDIISAPSKFSVQPAQKEVQPATEAKENENRKVDWKTIGIAGTALAAIVGAIILIKRGNTGKATETLANAGDKAGQTTEKNIKEADEVLKKLAEKFGISIEEVQKILSSKEISTIAKNKQNIRDNLVSCKVVEHVLKDVFGVGMPYSEMLQQALKTGDEAIINEIRMGIPQLKCNDAIVECLIKKDNVKKIKDGISIQAYYPKIDKDTKKIKFINFDNYNIEASKSGRYVHYTESSGGSTIAEYTYINPKNISRETPKITKVVNKHGYFKTYEKGDTDLLFVCPKGKQKILMLEYNPETKQIYDSRIIDSKDKSSIVIPKTNEMSEIAEIFDFAKISERDYISTLNEMVNNILK